MFTKPQQEHRWLEQMLGDWQVTSNSPDSCNASWTEHVRSLRGLWIVSEGRGAMPDGEPTETVMTLGFDPQTGAYRGTWIGSMMSHMWIYNGSLDATGSVLTLDCEGPVFDEPGRMAAYQDIITIVDRDRRTLTSRQRKDDGSWHTFMVADFRRIA